MDNKIHICSDDKLNSSELLKFYSLHKYFATYLAFETFNSFIVIGTNIGRIYFYELDASKINGKYYPNDEETITSICTL
ncbi:MAG: hypothetical protein ACK52J_01160 [bacterium]|jgi:hypothetical protein